MKMVEEQIIPRGVKNKRVLKAMRKVKRDQFVPTTYQGQAYDDNPLPIGYGQTISQPFIVASMSELLDPQPQDNILEIGTGSGYQAAILGEIVKEVFTIEIVEALGKNAQDTLKKLGYKNVHVKIGNGYMGWPEHAPYDGIVVTAAPDHIPPTLVQQLKPGGKMIIPVGPEGGIQDLMVITKNKDGEIQSKNLYPVRFVPFAGGTNHK